MTAKAAPAPPTTTAWTTFTALLAGACVGLNVGAAFAAFLMVPATGVGALVSFFRFVLAGSLILGPLATVFVLPPLVLGAKRGHTRSTSLLIAACLATGALLLLGVALGWMSGPGWIGISVAVVLTAGVFCQLPAILLLRVLIGHRVLRTAVLIGTAMAALGGVLSVVVA
ncbi:MAG: hypothetical protein K0S70_1833 [Microbacterium sp.]|jgi:hypothetical protein|nr:hypothetical protein [Microbacterium sp.]